MNSLANQSNLNFRVNVVDYGSTEEYSKKLEQLLSNYKFCKLIYIPTSFQLWNKSKAINVILKKCTDPYFFVGDIDMIFRNDFIEKLNIVKKDNEIQYFQVGFLSKEESAKQIPFSQYNIKHISGKEATGMSLYPTKLLKEINGYDEFYHGWGAEDSDVHERFRNLNIKVNFHTKEVLMLHHWHSRSYRSKDSLLPFHSTLEQINSKYLEQTVETKKTKANVKFQWGLLQEKMNFINPINLQITNEKREVNALLNGTLNDFKNKNIELSVSRSKDFRSLKTILKKVLGKKHKTFYSFQEVNDLLLITIICNYRTCYYEYNWDKRHEKITVKIAL
jgi:hypothetical protein